MLTNEHLRPEVTAGISPSHDLGRHSSRWVELLSWSSALTHLIQHCTLTMRDLPNMGEKERGKPDTTSPTTIQSYSMSTRDTATPGPSEEITRAPAIPAPAPGPGWRTGWRHFVYEKWRLCAFIALAVMVSRFSSRG